MVRRSLTNLVANLASGFLLFFCSERLFWTVVKPDDQLLDLTITWLVYSVLACVVLYIQSRFSAYTFPRVALAGAVYGWLAEGALVGTLYGTESSAPFPRSIIQTALSWHMLLSVIVGLSLLTAAVRKGSLGQTAAIAGVAGLFRAAWATFQWRESPPVMLPLKSFALQAFVTGLLLAAACGIISSLPAGRPRPGWFGLSISVLVLALFYSAQLKAHGPRALLLPVLVSSVILFLWRTNPRTEPPTAQTSLRKSWVATPVILVMPLVATIGYGLQQSLNFRGLNPAWIFNGLAFAGSASFIGAWAMIVHQTRTRHRGQT